MIIKRVCKLCEKEFDDILNRRGAARKFCTNECCMEYTQILNLKRYYANNNSKEERSARYKRTNQNRIQKSLMLNQKLQLKHIALASIEDFQQHFRVKELKFQIERKHPDFLASYSSGTFKSALRKALDSLVKDDILKKERKIRKAIYKNESDVLVYFYTCRSLNSIKKLTIKT
jgi:hypothetical protein